MQFHQNSFLFGCILEGATELTSRSKRFFYSPTAEVKYGIKNGFSCNCLLNNIFVSHAIVAAAMVCGVIGYHEEATSKHPNILILEAFLIFWFI